MKILYFDLINGISGDMALASLVDAGVSLKTIKDELKKLNIDGYTITQKKVIKHSIKAKKINIKIKETNHNRTFKSIKALIGTSSLSKKVKDLSIEIFLTLAKSEAKIHNTTIDKVHFHEVGAIDSIIDIVGTAIALCEINADIILSSPLPLGTGFVETQHGIMPVPAPATLDMLRNCPVVQTDIKGELTTPTGAAIIKTITSKFSSMPSFEIKKTGYGAGTKDFKEKPNIMRVVIGQGTGWGMGEDKKNNENEEIIEINTNIDDDTSEKIAYVRDILLERCAMDAFLAPSYMKKGRLATLLTVLVKEKDLDEALNIIFNETSTIGIRYHKVQRTVLERNNIKIKTRYGTVQCKETKKNGKTINIKPEFEDIKKIAKQKGLTVKAIEKEVVKTIGKI